MGTESNPIRLRGRAKSNWAFPQEEGSIIQQCGNANVLLIFLSQQQLLAIGGLYSQKVRQKPSIQKGRGLVTMFPRNKSP